MSTLKVGTISNLAGSKSMTTASSDLLGIGALQIVQVASTDIINFTTITTLMSTDFTPKSATSKLIISANVTATNTQTNDWHLWTAYLRVDSTDIYTRYIGQHYHQAYSPVDISFVYNSWGTSQKTISVLGSPHAGYNHQFNRKVWDPTTGGVNNTSTLRIMEIQTL